MWLIALSLGFMGSLHCIGMCGPIALAASAQEAVSPIDKLRSVLLYNIGRISTYAMLGLGFGLIGGMIYLVNAQKLLSILAGIGLVITFLFSMNIEHGINNTVVAKSLQKRVTSLLGKSMKNKSNQYGIGVINGLLPCGLVYLALTGALASGSVFGGVVFMILFGLGTVPAMVTITLGYSSVPVLWRSRFRRAIPFVSLVFGIYLIYRGVVVSAPQEFDFWHAIKHPVMCH